MYIFLPYFNQSKMITILGLLLQSIGQSTCTNFIQFLVYFLELFLCFNNFFHNCLLIIILMIVSIRCTL